MPSEELRKAWTEVVAPEDYDAHMAAIGQAEANAHLILHLIESHPPRVDETLLVAGAGTGQMFDYVSPELLTPYNVVFTDIRAEFLDRLRSRLHGVTVLRFKTVVDDVERSECGAIDAAALVLVLEHVNWRRAVGELIGAGARRLYIVIQVNPPDQQDAVTPTRILPGTLALVSAEAKPELVKETELLQLLQARGYALLHRREVAVPDGKTMLGLVFG
jgi:hypothetical protein